MPLKHFNHHAKMSFFSIDSFIKKIGDYVLFWIIWAFNPIKFIFSICAFTFLESVDIFFWNIIREFFII